MSYDWGTFDRRFVGQRVLLAVSQLPFEANYREFATLIPVTDLSARPFKSKEESFPTHGDVWWMVTAQTKSYAEPGRLLTAILEEAREQERSDKAYYQVMPDTLEPVREDSLVEIINIPQGNLSNPRDVIEPSFSLTIEHPPCAIVYARVGDFLYGPLSASSQPVQSGKHLVQLKAARDNRAVHRIPMSELRESPVTEEVTVSRDTRPVYQNGDPILCRYTILPSRAITEALPKCTFETWRTPGEIVRGVAKRLFDKRLIYKKDRQTFVRAFEEIEAVLLSSPDEFQDASEKDIFGLIRRNIDKIEREAAELAHAIVDSELIDDKISAAIQQRVEEHIASNSATVKSRIEEQISDKLAELEALETQKNTLEQELESERQRRLHDIEQEIARRKEQLREGELQIEKSRASLEEERKVLTETLKDVSEKLNQGKDETIRRFLELIPLLEGMNFLSTRGRVEPMQPAPGENLATSTPAKLAFSPFISKGISEDRELVSELSFFDRFSEHVSASGFGHRRIDLVAFHLSIKCNDIVILGGEPGTGKSSLPNLYSEALIGDEYEEGSRFLHVGVSPSWVDTRDLLGFVNAFERTFQPSESGLYMHLVNAQEEEERRGAQSGLWITCLDEMNLAQVEHYFGSFLQALERPIGQRLVNCFAPQTVSEDSPLRKWSSLRIPPSVRFVGTVNFDETTRELSQRLLDRANLLRLKPPRTALQSSAPVPAKPKGKPISMVSMHEWTKRGESIPREAAEILDEIEVPLKKLGCALNPRRQRALSTFIANAPAALCTPLQALDLQIAQRILPRVRGLYRSGAQDNFEQVRKILDSKGDFPESSYVMHQIAEESLPGTMLPED